MTWLDFIFGRRKSTPERPRHKLRWTSHRGDEWWCGDAAANFSCNNFTIASFGKYTASMYAMELIVDARNEFPDATINIDLDNDTEAAVRGLKEQHLIETREIQLSPRTRIARIEYIATQGATY